MQINQNSYTSYTTNAGSGALRPQDQGAQKPAVKPMTRDAVKADSGADKVIDQNTRGKLIAQNAYAGTSQRGGILDIIV
jgi:hypothetical protein